ncbi:uncharacterized protein LOC126374236 [Pectinophora gossypiella]|uniref:uncharacterized protein LOC126374236 n=1 Tax=Pectinophora gossypiella TaxID=13191 RepID=UPI00214EB4B2|nr:uncharacterized protein LOC126374236 [Pectinophora gossypiella]
MDIPEIKPSQDIAVDLVVSVINKAQEKLGIRQNLFQIAKSRNILTNAVILSMSGLRPPLAMTSERLIKDAIEKTWRLTDALSYHVVYLGGSQDECSQYYYHEVIFSQPTVAYPIPQATVSVYFRLEDKHVEPLDKKEFPTMIFRIEGHNAEHDVRYVRLSLDWILAALQMKIKFFQRVEKIRMF